MISLRSLWITILLLIFAKPLLSNDLQYRYEVSTFKYNSDSVYLVLDFSFSQENIGYQSIEGKYYSNVQFDVTFAGDSDTITNSWNIAIATDNPATKAGKLFIGSKQFILIAGEYKLHTNLTDNINKANIEATSVEKCEPVPSVGIQLSEIELGYSVSKISELEHDINKDFVKADLYFIPNPSNEVSGTEPKLLYYYEVYNFDNNLYDSLRIEYSVLSAMKFSIIKFNKTLHNLPKDFYDYNSVVLDTLASGLYYLDIAANAYKDGKIINVASTQKKFYLMNPQLKPKLNTYFSEDELFARSEFSSMTDEQVELEFAQIQVIASTGEKEIWRKLHDSNAKRKYLFAFWNNRKGDKSQFVNDEREKYKQLIQKANIYYSRGSVQDGWRTDRGRILLKYGNPNNIETYTAQDGNKAYEIWEYDAIGGGSEFYFVDLMGSGNYSLVHSTLIEEKQNSDWKERILKSH